MSVTVNNDSNGLSDKKKIRIHESLLIISDKMEEKRKSTTVVNQLINVERVMELASLPSPLCSDT